MSEVADNEKAAIATYVRTTTADASTRPKSKKELRAEKKAAKKSAAAAAASPTNETKMPSKHESKEEKYRLKKERRKQQLKEREKEFLREKKERQKKRKARELHAVGGGLDPVLAAKRLEERKNKKKRKKEQKDALEESKFFGNDMAVFDKVFNGTGEEDEEGVRTLEMGVKCKDVVIGKGQIVENNSLLTVMYKLKSGKGILIDSSKKFIFRVGKGNVIRGWDIGVLGMAVGGVRKLIVPPKVGYQGQDIGAGPGALLYFDITVLACT
eukprot:scaffold1924_cov140-Skeletonema_menzelii.AAC.23